MFCQKRFDEYGTESIVLQKNNWRENFFGNYTSYFDCFLNEP